MFQQPKTKEPEQDAIIVENISKRFKIPHEKKRTVYENITGILKGNRYGYEEFWALRDVSFTVKRGETLGIIGENGSGKSTLLKVIAGVLYPDSGYVKVNGRIAPFLELGVGFQPELTAEENVYLYGSIMGMNRAQIENKINDIFEFAELGKFRNAKLKNFSSGMYARLAFSTAISTEPDIILIDEALAVGDEAFQGKCYDKINEFKKNEKTIVFVSHALEIVKDLCERSILLNHGITGSIGNSEKVANDYRINLYKKEESNLIQQHEKNIETITVKQESIESELEQVPKANNLKIKEKLPYRWGSGEIEITEVKFFDKDGKETYLFETSMMMIARIKYIAHEEIKNPVFGVAIHRNDGIHINGPNTKISGYEIVAIEGEGYIEYIIDSLPLLSGTYLFTAAIYDYTCLHPYDHQEKAFTFRVVNVKLPDSRFGTVYIPCRWKLVVT